MRVGHTGRNESRAINRALSGLGARLTFVFIWSVEAATSREVILSFPREVWHVIIIFVALLLYFLLLYLLAFIHK